jgi:hypothetical protein
MDGTACEAPAPKMASRLAPRSLPFCGHHAAGGEPTSIALLHILQISSPVALRDRGIIYFFAGAIAGDGDAGRGKMWVPTDRAVYKLLTDWGSFIGGLLALLAGGAAYFAGRQQADATRAAARAQVEAIRRGEEREVEALRMSLATEIRQLAANAIGVHTSLRNLATKPSGPITARIVESLTLLPVAVIYPGSATKIGLLDARLAMDVVTFYNLIDIGREGSARLVRSRTPDYIVPSNVAAVADAFLEACKAARDLLPILKTGVEAYDKKDANLIKMIRQRESEWDAITASRPKTKEASG